MHFLLLGRIETLNHPKGLGYNPQKKQDDFYDGTQFLISHAEGQ
jgi:hypothetical protein